MGVAKDGSHKPGYTQGIDIKAPMTVLAEGCRGSLSKQLIAKYALDKDSDPQTYGIGIKELWQLPPGRVEAGKVVHTLGWPLNTSTYGGSFLYHLDKDRIAIGFVAGLDYADPLFRPFEAFQQLKNHALIKPLLDGGTIVSAGARAIDRRRLSVAAENRDAGRAADRRFGRTAERAEDQGHAPGDPLGHARRRAHRGDWRGRWLRRETARLAGHGGAQESAQHPPRFQQGAVVRARQRRLGNRDAGPVAVDLEESCGLVVAGQARRGRSGDCCGCERRVTETAGYVERSLPPRDRLAGVYFAATEHDEDQPVHLHVADTSICVTRCAEEYGNPCTRFCPAGVYEIVADLCDGSAASACRSTRRTACTARPATSRTRTRSSRG